MAAITDTSCLPACVSPVIMNPKKRAEYQELFDEIILNAQYRLNKDVMSKISKSFETLVGADCWAVVVDDDHVIFNNYRDEHLHPAKRIDEMNRRDALIENSHCALFHHIYRAKASTHVDVYMFENSPSAYMVRFEYYVESGEEFWTVSVYTKK